ncbi:MAG TPA: cbb3-type cytochrome c oxidase subunit I [Gemmatimonadaceae bacterium]|nr:cbb3-type cytochrome c oxidase subunit I [Gemmatimonadaceae bacterium]
MTVTERPVAGAGGVPAPAARNASTDRLILANVWVAVLAFGIAAVFAMMQAISRGNLELPYRTPRMYYMSVTAHGVLMALVFTTFFIMGFGYAIAQSENGDLRWPRAGWAAWLVSLLGTLAALWAIFTFRASVLYTFYPPMQAHPAFYIGLTLLVVGSWWWAVEMIASWRAARRRRGDRPVSLAMHATTANALLWLLATLGVAAEMLFQLIPWSLGLVQRVDPLLARTLFWFFGHPLVYFWILPAYTVWYTVLPREAGGYLFSEPLGRMVFALFLILSTPVGFHHQFQDPGIPASWKLFHTFNTMVISFPSLVTAFTICASLEVAGRLRGGTGLFGWIRRLPWGDPTVASVLLAMLLFLVGGFGGAINAAYMLNSVVHNTAWIHGHFHLTVGSAAALTFMGAAYWLVPKVSGRELELRLLAKIQPYLWFAGMIFFAISSHITGLMGLPRRVYEVTYGGAPQARPWIGLTQFSAIGGIILLVSAFFFVLVIVGTLLAGPRREKEPLLWAESLGRPDDGFRVGLWDRLGLFFAIAVVLVIIAYAVPLWDILHLTRYGSPAFRPY